MNPLVIHKYRGCPMANAMRKTYFGIIYLLTMCTMRDSKPQFDKDKTIIHIDNPAHFLGINKYNNSDKKLLKMTCSGDFNVSTELDSLENTFTSITIADCSLPKNESILEVLCNKFPGILKNQRHVSLINTNIINFVMPKEYFEELQELELQSNADVTTNVLSLDSSDVFENVTKLQKLHLGGIKIKNFDKDFLKSLPVLDMLIIDNINITSIPEHFFDKNKDLTSLTLTNNQLMGLEDLSLEKLKILRIVDNPLTNISANAFSSLIALEKLFLMYSEIEYISNDSFRTCKTLTKVQLNYNLHLKKIPNSLFANLTNLRFVYLDNCNITSLSADTFIGSNALEILQLENNRISNLSETFLEGAVKLKHLTLQHNQLGEIPICIKNLKQITKLDFSYNSIKHLEASYFKNLTNLRIINLNNNSIASIDSLLSPSSSGTKLTTADFNKNLFTFFSSDEVEIKLKNNAISSLCLSDVIANQSNKISAITIDLDENPMKCDCKMYHVAKYNDVMRERSRKFGIRMENLTCQNDLNDSYSDNRTSIEEIPKTKFICDIDYNEGCPKECICFWRPEDRAIVVNCTDKELKFVPPVDLSNVPYDYNHTEIHLEYNLLKSAPPETAFKNVTNITELYLSHNDITEIIWIPRNLEVFEIDNNKLSRINLDILTTLNSTNNLSLHNNPWKCDCAALDLVKFLSNHLEKLDGNHTIRCYDSENILTKLTSGELCIWWTTFRIISMFLFILLLITSAITLTLYYRYEDYVKAWLLSNKWCRRYVRKPEKDDKEFDVFICCSEEDQIFMRKNILSRLEYDYKVCTEYRDFEPETLIYDQIATKISNSHRILIVLSNTFHDSAWNRHLLLHSDMKAILVLMSDYNEDTDDHLNDVIKVYKTKRTYLKWGDSWFWTRLRYALPHKNISSRSPAPANDCNNEEAVRLNMQPL